MVAFRKQGHRVISLSQEDGALIHAFLKGQGVETFTHIIPGRRGAFFFLRHLIFFVRFCWQMNVDVVYSHLEPANFVSSLGQFFIRAKVLTGRHHVDAAALDGFDRSIAYRLTYSLAKTIIVPSQHAKDYMVEKENVKRERIIQINLAYDFSYYTPVSQQAVDKIKSEYRSGILLVFAGRLTTFKHPEKAVQVLEEVRRAGLDAHLLLLGRGEEEENLRRLIADKRLQKFVSMPGYVSSILDFFKAADFLIHPSVAESSCVVIKEAGLTNTPVVVCRGIGDFDAYLRHDENAFMVNPETFVAETVDVILRNHADLEKLNRMGLKLQDDVLRLFSIENILPCYEQFNGVPPVRNNG